MLGQSENIIKKISKSLSDQRKKVMSLNQFIAVGVKILKKEKETDTNLVTISHNELIITLKKSLHEFGCLERNKQNLVNFKDWFKSEMTRDEVYEKLCYQERKSMIYFLGGVKWRWISQH